jgi:hypothetical protein
VPGDYNGDTFVNWIDYLEWKQHFGATVSAGTGADGNGNGIVDAADYVVWRKNVAAGAGSASGANGAVPEPTSAALAVIVCTVMGVLRRSSLCRHGVNRL